MVRIIQKSKIWFGIFLTAFVVGAICAGAFGLKLGIDFTGGSMLEGSFTGSRPSQEQIIDIFHQKGVADPELKLVGDNDIAVRFKTVNEETHGEILKGLAEKGSFAEKSFNSIGPVIGVELAQKSLMAIGLALLLIMGYITYVFRRVSRPVASWKYGAAAIITLFHDLVVVIGAFALLGHFAGIEITAPFVASFLTILGFSVHDTIVVFDRIRENLLRTQGTFEEIVNKSINETIARSVNTSLTVLLTVASVYIFGGESLKTFALSLLLGIGIGTYSSIFVASPMLVIWHQWTQRNKEKAGKRA